LTIDELQIQLAFDLMNKNIRDCLVENYHDIIPTLNLPDENDRHVLAAAIRLSNLEKQSLARTVNHLRNFSELI
jgi:hypothetical protein